MKRIGRAVCASAMGLLFLLLPAATVSAQEDLEGTLVTIEKSLWEAWKNKDAKPFEEHITKESVNITAMGITSGKAALIDEITNSDCDVKSYSLSDVKLHRLGKDAAMLTYKAAQDATCAGEKIPAEVLVSSTYVKEADAWRAASYQETPVISSE
jgi:hypothetical protein